MKKTMMKRLPALLLAIMLLWTVGGTALAADLDDAQRRRDRRSRHNREKG